MSTTIPRGEGGDRLSAESRALEPNEQVALSFDPLPNPTPELAEICKPYGPIVAEIYVADMRFAIVDTREEGLGFTLVNQPEVQHSPEKYLKGVLSLLKDQDTVIGRNHYTRYLDYTSKVSGDHLVIRYQDDGITIENLEPTNKTVVTGNLKDRESVYQQLEVPRRGLADAVDIRKMQIEAGGPITLTSAESLGILEQAEIHGDSFLGQRLTTDILRQEGLEPRYAVTLQDDVYCYLSDPYDIGDDRIAAVGYVDTPQGIVARTYYRSNSQGTWRYLPKYELEANKVVWYAKGFGEESILLPSKLQSALANISRNIDPVLTRRNPDFIFAGTAREVRNKVPGTLNAEVKNRPLELNPRFRATRESAPSPESLVLTYPQSPNFAALVDSWEQPSELYGVVHNEVYESNDGALRYIFCSDSHRRVWIGGIETDAEVRSIGLRSTWVDAGMLTTPAYEYPGQGYGYENTNLSRNRYVDMYQNYISKIPVIQEYLRSKGQWG